MKTQGIEKWVRILTVPPLMALAALSILLAVRPAIFDGVGNYLAAVFFLTVLPLLAYPLQPILPHYKDQGRAGQRKLAMLMAVAGYVAGAVMGIVCVVPKGLMQIYLIYLISGVLTLLFNKVFKIKASGHACGIAGPVAYLVYFVGWPALAGCIVLAMAYWASLRMGRHTWPELLLGSAIPVAVTVLLACL